MQRYPMSMDMMLYEDPREMQSRVVSPAEEAMMRAMDVEMRDRPVESVVSPVDVLGPSMVRSERSVVAVSIFASLGNEAT